MPDTKNAKPGRRSTRLLEKTSSGGQQSLLNMFLKKPAVELPTLTSDQQEEDTIEIVDVTEEVTKGNATEAVKKPEKRMKAVPQIAPQPMRIASKTNDRPVFSIFQKRMQPVAAPLFPSQNELTQPTPIDIIHVSDDESNTESKAQNEVVPAVSSLAAGSPNGTTRGDPIVIDASPETKLVALKPHTNSKPMFPIFTRPKPIPSLNIRQESPFRHLGFPKPTFPSNESQHVRGAQTIFTSASMPFSHRQPLSIEKPSSTSDDMSTSLHGVLGYSKIDNSQSHLSNATPSLSLNLDKYLDDMPKAHRAFPAISRILKQKKLGLSPPFTPSHDTWADKWRPKRADEVLGNEVSSLYLKDWLVALRLQIDSGATTSDTKLPQEANRKRKAGNLKKRTVVRHVKKRRTAYAEEFIIDDGLSDTTGVDDIVDDDIAFCQQMQEQSQSSTATSPATTDIPSSPISSPPQIDIEEEDMDDLVSPFSSLPTQFGSVLYNTILISGPSGCGKTASVYACANELGWDVFEVYPGIGERNGSELNKLIGDVGKNHLVRSTNRYASPEVSNVRRTVQKNPRRVLSDDEDSTQVVWPAATQSPTPPVEVQVKQSLILVEEVDILYQSDSGFWSALINIIGNSRRPVVLTCNDSSLVPISDLPLQAVLQFVPSPSNIATSYLQALCYAEGHPFERDFLTRLFEGDDRYQQSSLCGEEDFAHCHSDLRHSLQQLQYLSEASASLLGDIDLARQFHYLNLFSETISCIDYQLADSVARETIHELVEAGTRSPNDELGYNILRYDVGETVPITPVSVFYHRESDFAEERLRRLLNTHTPALRVEPLALHSSIGNAGSDYGEQCCTVARLRSVDSIYGRCGQHIPAVSVYRVTGGGTADEEQSEDSAVHQLG
ncbi:hypothetical protein ABKN59_000439 [Abortiporus biennis]